LLNIYFKGKIGKRDKKLFYVTGNKNKFGTAEGFLKPRGIEIVQRGLKIAEMNYQIKN